MMNNMTRLVRAPLINTDTLSLVPVSTGFDVSIFLFIPSHPNSLLAMFWLLLGLVEEGDIAVKDPSFRLTSAFGRLFLMAYVICTVIVALNMLIAMMNNSFEKIMVRE